MIYTKIKIKVLFNEGSIIILYECKYNAILSLICHLNVNNKKLYTITPDENGYIGGLKTAYDESIKQKQTGYKPVDIPNVVPQTKPTVAPKPTTVAPKPTIAPKPNQVQKKVEKTTTTPDWGFK